MHWGQCCLLWWLMCFYIFVEFLFVFFFQTIFKTCPVNPEHQVPEKSLEKHIHSCKERLEGYLNEDNFLPDAGSPAESFVKLGMLVVRPLLILRKLWCFRWNAGAINNAWFIPLQMRKYDHTLYTKQPKKCLKWKQVSFHKKQELTSLYLIVSCTSYLADISESNWPHLMLSNAPFFFLQCYG